MHSLPAARLLDAWERGYALTPDRRAILLLEAAWPEETPEALARLPIGHRDARLLDVRTHLFGESIEAVVACPACGQTLELAVDAGDLRVEPPGPAPRAAEFVVDRDGYTVRFRLPNTEDVVAAKSGNGHGPALLLQRCVVEARRGDTLFAAEDLPEAVVTAVADEMETADPQARLSFDLRCPDCGHSWESAFDIVAYLWTEIDAWARRTLRDVHGLARAYGWTEPEILAMSAWRRQAYLNLIHG